MGIKVQHDGHEIEVELPAGYIAETDVKEKFVPKEFMASEIQRRLAGKADPDKLLEDDSFRQKALEKWGVKPEKPAKPSGEDVERLHREWAEKHLTPVKQEAERFRGTVDRLRVRDLQAQILQAAADAGVKKTLLKAPVEGAPAPIIHMLAPYLGHSEEHDAWFVREGDTFAYASTPSKERPFKGIAEFVADWAKDKANADWIEDTRQRGASFQKAGTGGAPAKPLKDMSVAEKSAFIQEHGIDAFTKMVYGGQAG